MDTQSPFSLLSLGEKEPRERIIRQSASVNDLGDDPAAHRWRAWWDRSYSGDVIGVKLECYPVIKATPCGAWIDPFAYRQWGANGMEWSEPHRELLRWVGNTSGQAWAKPTQKEAVDSLLYRYRRWGKRVLNDIAYFMEASDTLKAVRPECSWMADEAMHGLRSYIAAPKAA